MNETIGCDVAIIGGGPAGSTAACLLRKYNPDLRVCVFEREVFPRDHIGESLLPPISPILVEMGCWDKIEGANFPIKVGATYRWGKKPELWDFDFVPVEHFENQPRPAKFEGARTGTAFQVDRSIYDKILLDHAAEMGCEVRQGTKVAKVHRDGDRVTGLDLESGDTVTARHFINASGNSGILRRAVGIECENHPTLQNIAIWDYWQNADWAVKIGVGGTRIQIRSLPYGWIWFIPMGPTRTSIGLVIPVEYSKRSGLKPAELYAQALRDEREIASLLSNATCEDKLTATKDWSFLADRNTGENWYLIGECAGFADPILSAGVTMAHVAGQQVAYTINEIERGGNAEWLKGEFGLRQRQRIKTHIRFGDYWYSANEQFQDLKVFTSKLAKGCGLDLTPDKAWQWIAQGGFINEDLGIGIGGFGLASVKASNNYLADIKFESPLERYNVFKLDLQGAETKDRASYVEGRVYKTLCYLRAGNTLPVFGTFEVLIKILEIECQLPQIVEILYRLAEQHADDPHFIRNILMQVAPALEGMVSDGWVSASYDPRLPLAKLDIGYSGFHPNKDNR